MFHALHPPKRLAAATLAAAAAALALLVFAAGASAARDPIASGSTDLHMKKGFLRKAANLDIGVVGASGGTVTGNKIAFEVNGGKLDPTNVEGFLETEGGFRLVRGDRGVVVTAAVVNTVKGSVYASVGGARMQFATFKTPNAGREGFGVHFKAAQLTLTEKSARRISNQLGLKGGQRLKGGRVMSNLYSTEQPSTVTVLAQGNATLTGNVATFAKFGAKGVKLPEGISAIAPATKPTPTSFAFPITGGTLAVNAGEGTVNTAGGVQILKETKDLSPLMKMIGISVDFKAKTATVELEITPTPPFPGAVGRSSIADVVLPNGAVTTNPTNRTITITNAEAKLQAVAASTLNDVFNSPAPSPPPASNFVAGDPLGTFSLTAQAQ